MYCDLVKAWRNQSNFQETRNATKNTQPDAIGVPFIVSLYLRYAKEDLWMWLRCTPMTLLKCERGSQYVILGN